MPSMPFSRPGSLRSAVASRRFAVGLAASTALVVLFVAGPKAAEPQPELRVLFIGNSFTYYHDLPKMLAELAKSGGQRPIYFQQETPGGCTLEKHWKDGKALAKIRSGRWDFVVLQDQSQAPLLNRASMFEYAKKLNAEIKKQGAVTILFMTWALQNKPADQSAISTAYEKLSRELKTPVVPVGNAWKMALASDKNLVLHDMDQKHPSPTGTYLAACVFYATLYGKSPEGLPGSIGGLTDQEARRLQFVAWKTVQ